jgi:hypothetical protein
MHEAQIFVGATSSDYNVVSGTSGPVFDVSASTGHDVPPVRSTTVIAAPDGLREWIDSEEARQYERRWVLLDDDLTVIDADTSPSALLQRHPEIAAPTVVYVQPRDETVVV